MMDTIKLARLSPNSKNYQNLLKVSPIAALLYYFSEFFALVFFVGALIAVCPFIIEVIHNIQQGIFSAFLISSKLMLLPVSFLLLLVLSIFIHRHICKKYTID